MLSRTHTDNITWIAYAMEKRTGEERDFEQTILLRDEGWTVLRFWGSEINDDVATCAQRIIECISQKKLFGKKNIR